MDGTPRVTSSTATRPRTRLETRLYLLALVVTIMVRAAAVAGTDPQSVWIRWSGAKGAEKAREKGQIWDQALYDRFGWNLATEGILGVGSRPSAFCMPAYPILLAGTYKLVGHLPGAVRWVQVLLSTLTVVFLGILSRRLGGPRAEIIAILIGAGYPFFVYFVREVLTETLFLGAFVGTLLTASRVGARGRIIDGMLHGIATSLAVMTRPVGFFLALGTLILARPWASEGRTRRLVGLFLGALIVAGVWGSWILRNRQVFGETVPLDTHGGWSLYMGQLASRGVPIDQALQLVGYHHGDILTGKLPGGPRGELEADRRAGENARAMIRRDPATFVATFFGNVRGLWLGSYFGDVAESTGVQILMTLAALSTYLPILVLGLLGLLQCWKTGRRDFFWAAVLLLATSTLLHGIVQSGKRYRAETIDPVLLVLAAWQASRLLARWWREPEPIAELAAVP